ncbi:hypothetical protein [Psychrosphaera algicola]|uniref:Glycosyltransferase family 2 protein n=1 Tax=Psychrosphaera algicola TaxID=3023714 RepID=A0ABT5FEU7_9GAMM|nr:hypothetical protein [Psychrosphaera sp. G1-22]MDC2890033.1 hypothetical protein [Psychrosphaera sp. G1-22]
MKFGIVIPLKSKKISRDWAVTSAALEGTIRSIQNQTDQNFVVSVAGHDCPEFFKNMLNERFRFTKVDYDAPDRNAPNFKTQELINDKVLKIMTGLIAIKDEPLSWIYQLDSDDLIRNDFIEQINIVPPTDAIIVEGGYIYYQSAQRIIETNEMDQLCGSVVVVKPSTFSFPPSADLQYIHDLPWTKYRHMNIYKFFENNNQSYTRSSENLVTYLLATGDNFSDRWRTGLVSQIKAVMKPYLFGKKYLILLNLNFH